jgi:histidinol-phosphate/aromatic aminotransferase/cobyric acid decarboxylase-like protein
MISQLQQPAAHGASAGAAPRPGHCAARHVDFSVPCPAQSRGSDANGRQMVAAVSRTFSLTVMCSTTATVRVLLPQGWDETALRDHLLAQHGIDVRACSCQRTIAGDLLCLAIRPEEDVRRLLDGVADYATQHGRGTAA